MRIKRKNAKQPKLFFLPVFVFGVLLGATNLNAQVPYCREFDDRYLIFLDKSGSMSGTTTSVGDKTLTELINFLGEKLDNGNRIKGHYLHEKTISSTPFLDDVNKVPCPVISNSMGVRTKTNLEKQYYQSIAELKKQTLIKLKSSIELKSTSSTTSSTDIWSTFELMSRFFKGTPSGRKRIVIFLTDMKESSKKSGGRDFDRKAPKDKQEAELWAKEDYQKIKAQYAIDVNALKGITVYILFPDTQLTGSAKDKILYYWEPLFKAFGITDVHESLK